MCTDKLVEVASLPGESTGVRWIQWWCNLLGYGESGMK